MMRYDQMTRRNRSPQRPAGGDRALQLAEARPGGSAGPAAIAPASVAQLQRTCGTRAVSGLLCRAASAGGVIQRVKKEYLMQQQKAIFKVMSDWVGRGRN